jgi:periplasmic copper chaperone A
LHTSTSSDGVARMRPVTGGLEIPAGEEVELRPGGSHIMISGLKGALAPGATLPLRLRFERGGEREVAVRVRSDAP